jgi:uncharacterized membrane protein YdjX (TVP38/TMEM64 family)
MIALMVIALAAFAAPYWWPVFQDPQVIHSWLTASGPWAPIVYVLLQALQIVIFIVPGEVTQIAAGWAFGFGWGSVLSVIGAVLGSAAAFGLARLFGVALVHRIAGQQAVAKFDKLMESPRFIGSIFLLFLIPGVPKDILCYVAGLSSLKFLPFLLFGTVARLPGILGSSLMGKALFHGDWLLLAVIAGVAVVLFGIGWWFRDPIFKLIERVATKHKEVK